MSRWVRALAAFGSASICGTAFAAIGATPVPEPDTLALIGLGLVAIGLARGRYRG